MDKDAAWPAVDWEEHPWRLDREYGVSKSALRRHAGPYRSAVVPAIASRQLRLRTEILMAAEEALQELVRFDAEMAGSGEIAPLAAVLLRTESASSSQIENLTSGARQIAVASLGLPAGHNAELIAANTRVMESAIQMSERLDSESIIRMQQVLLGGKSIAGWRTEQVWIGGTGFGPHGAEFVPPHHDRVAAAMLDLEKFMSREDLPVLPQAAVAHAHFETIHPFPDGNGRTGRALLHAKLRARGAIRHVTVPVSAGLLVDVAAYFAALDKYRAGDPDQIVLVVSDAVFAATANARQLIADLRLLQQDWQAQVTARSDSVVWSILRSLPRQPVVDTAFVSSEFQVSKVAAQRALDQLVTAGILREFTGRKRSRLWVADQVTAQLDAFAARAGRRS